jgi:hypothetical protein
VRIRIAVPDAHVSPEVLNAALEASTLANQSLLRTGEAPPVSELINAGKVKWAPEPFTDGEHFDLLDEIKKRDWADCDDLAPAYAAELRENGTDPDAHAAVVKSGPNTWHAKVFHGDGSEAPDPSRAAGMGRKSSVSGPMGLYGTSVMGMADVGVILGVKPYQGRWAARCDIPQYEEHDAALSGLAILGDPCAALARAIKGAALVGIESDTADPEQVARALAVHAAVTGASFDEALEVCGGHIGEEEVGSIFSSIAHAVAPIAHLIPKKVLKAVVAPSLAFDAQLKKIPGAGKLYDRVSRMAPFHAEREGALHELNKAFGYEKHTPAEIHAATAAQGPVLDPSSHVSVTRNPEGGFTVRF